MKYKLNDKWQKINEKKGEMENPSKNQSILLASNKTVPEEEVAVKTVNPNTSYPFKVIDEENLYAKLSSGADEELEVSVVNFPWEEEGGDTDFTALENEIRNQGKQLQNCYEKPHESLDYALWVENGELKEWSKDGKSKLQTSNQLGNGNSDTRSLDGKGFDSVIKQDNLYIGEGYENILDNFTEYGADIDSIEKLDPVTYKIYFSGNTLSYGGLLGINGINTAYLEDGTITDCRLEIIEQGGQLKGKRIGMGTTSERAYLQKTFTHENIIKKSAKWKLVTGSAKRFTLLHPDIANLELVSATDYIILKNAAYVKRSYTASTMDDLQTPLPFVIGFVSNGRVVLNAPWNSDNHSFIIRGVTLKKNTKDNVYYLYFCGSTQNESCYLSSSTGFVAGDVVDILISKTVNIVIRRSDGDGKSTNIVNRGVVGATIDIAGIYDNQDYIESIDFFEGDLTEQELRSELNKTKKNKLEAMGFVENIPNSKKRIDERGMSKTHLSVTLAEKNEDIYVINEDDMYEIIDSNGVSYTTVGVDGTILAGSKIKNVAGYVVTDDTVATYPLKLRVVK